MNDIKFEDVKVEMPKLRVEVSGQAIHVTFKELRLLLLFLSDPYQVFSMEQMINQADMASEHDAWNNISKLRKKLGHKYIVNVGGGRYKFAEEVIK